MRIIKTYEGHNDNDKLVTIYSEMSDEKPYKFVEKKVPYSDLKDIFRTCGDSIVIIEKEFPDFKVIKRGSGQFYDIEFSYSGKFIWIGTYDSFAKNFYLFIGNSLDNYLSRKVNSELHIEKTSLKDGFERFVGLWYEIYDDL